ncbi:poly-beta-hydroxybutyrate-responsive repressor [bacterium]|nr:MAG: poly-beta-hydroxybutyrate-responsive repressor [bacterium]
MDAPSLRVTPKNYLMAWLLVMLEGGNLHGYEIAKHLRDRFAFTVDAGAVYRALRRLEREGLIASWWSPHAEGPTRRLYALTPDGHEALARWSAVLADYRHSLDAFFELYEAAPKRR